MMDRIAKHKKAAQLLYECEAAVGALENFLFWLHSDYDDEFSDLWQWDRHGRALSVWGLASAEDSYSF